MLVVALVASLALLPGCGLQTDEANKKLEQANAHQHQAEEIMARLKALPNEWQQVFAGSGVTAASITQARQLVDAREADVEALDEALKEWSTATGAIQKLNVEQKIKDYVKLKMAAIKQWRDYSSGYLRPLVKGYGGLLDTIAAGKPLSEQEKAAADLTNLTSESIGKLQECLNAEKQAEKYFKENKLGN